VAAQATPSYVYALGRIQVRFPTLDVEKELAQVTGRAETATLTDGQALHKVLSQRHNRYLARQLCYVLTVQEVETYLLHPGDPGDFDLLIEAVRSSPRATDLDLVTGIRGAIAPPEVCGGLMVPMVTFNQIYSFDRDSLIKEIPRQKEIPESQFKAAAEELFDRMMQMASAGERDEDRAVNYALCRYPAIYAKAAAEFARNSALSAVDVRLAHLGGVRKIINIILVFTNRTTDVPEKFFFGVDVTGLNPFLASKLAPYIDR
jgi:hypothetical protein